MIYAGTVIAVWHTTEGPLAADIWLQEFRSRKTVLLPRHLNVSFGDSLCWEGADAIWVRAGCTQEHKIRLVGTKGCR